ncbi:hypothetical protein EXIGLDRAFT_465167 [Exidia glandulosa HHB12029]|uniref:Uncharacterized protein n=1 Tax=Exidia glandulosa HHB12029 TaxID=1314781 RepID=A0A165K279_EXIGL|nr:hypothetical protein EXIGLDRAFT_465167 [Exidia glandulosa HHB12029]
MACYISRHLWQNTQLVFYSSKYWFRLSCALFFLAHSPCSYTTRIHPCASPPLSCKSIVPSRPFYGRPHALKRAHASRVVVGRGHQIAENTPHRAPSPRRITSLWSRAKILDTHKVHASGVSSVLKSAECPFCAMHSRSTPIGSYWEHAWGTIGVVTVLTIT